MSTRLVRTIMALQSSCSHESLTRSPSSEKRKQEAERIRQKYPDRIPVSFPSYSLPRFVSLTGVASTLGNLREGRPDRYSYHRQEEVSCTFSAHRPAYHERRWIADRRFIRLFPTQDLTVGQFVYVIRKRIKLAPEKAIFIFVEEVLPPTAALMSAIYEEHK